MEAARQLKLLELQEVNGQLEIIERTMRIAAFNLGHYKARRDRLVREIEQMYAAGR